MGKQEARSHWGRSKRMMDPLVPDSPRCPWGTPVSLVDQIIPSGP